MANMLPQVQPTHGTAPLAFDAVVALIAIVVLPLFVYGLGDTYLWQDEAQTALLGRSVLIHGVPMVGEGADSLSAVLGKDAGIGGVYFQIAWLQAYVEAASLGLFGESSWSARFPFAIAGWLCIPLTAWAMRVAGSTVLAARIAALSIACSVPFIIVSRQARYYALTAAIVLATIGTYAAFIRAVRSPERRAAAVPAFAFATAASLLVVSFDITAIGVLAAIACHWLLTTRAREWRWSPSFWMAWTIPCVLLAVWLAASLTATSRTENAGLTAIPGRLRYTTFYYLGQINAHIVPLPVLLLLLLPWRVSANKRADEVDESRRAVVLLAAVALGGLAGTVLSPHRFFRYIVPVFPVVLALSAIGIATMWTLGPRMRIAAAILLAALVSTNVLFVWSHAALGGVARASGMVTVRERQFQARVPIADLISELRDPPRGPVTAVIAYLQQHAGPRDVVVAAYGDLPLKFHTQLRVYGGETGEVPPPDIQPQWVWPRHLVVYANVRPVTDWIGRELESGRYGRVELQAIDRRWENREDPEAHIFFNPGPPGPRVVLYKARD
jgi:4-amino-4-deoxy-L-arabinose transferase-like glycosyltransferase